MSMSDRIVEEVDEEREQVPQLTDGSIVLMQ